MLTHTSQTTLQPQTAKQLAEDLHYWLALWRTPGIGPLRFFKLLQLFPQLSPLFNTSVARLSSLGLPEGIIQGVTKPDWTGVQIDLKWAESPQHHIVTWTDDRYPYLLRQIPDAPPILFVAGDPKLLHTRQFAMVGSRNPTPTGLESARQFAAHLSQSGLTITSGLALGIDAASHKGALKNGQPTIAVQGCGLDLVYPPTHRQLAEQITAQGALVSEFPIGTGIKAAHFPRRNRLVSGMSLGVLVVEATLRSGSLITARLASEQGREVFAIPGSIYNPLAQGCHLLIRQGAKLVENVTDILEELGAIAAAKQDPLQETEETNKKNFLDANCQQLLECVGYEATTVDQMVARSGLMTQVVFSGLLVLELQDFITAVPGGYIKNIPKQAS